MKWKLEGSLESKLDGVLLEKTHAMNVLLKWTQVRKTFADEQKEKNPKVMLAKYLQRHKEHLPTATGDPNTCLAVTGCVVQAREAD